MISFEYYVRNEDCRGPRLWRAHPEDCKKEHEKICTCEVETLEFMKALAGLLKPRLIVELGCNVGIAAEYLLDGYNASVWIGIEIDAELANRCRKRLQRFDPRATVITGSSRNFPELWMETLSEMDLLFVDGDEHNRLDDMRLWIPRMSQFGVCLVHDTDTSRDLRRQAEQAAQELDLQLMHLPTPRGLSLLRKKTKEERS